MDPKKKLSGVPIKYKSESKITYSKIYQPMGMNQLERMHQYSQEKKLISEHFKFLEMEKTKHKHKAKERNDMTNRTINMIENTFRKKYDSEYIKKICQLLKKKDKNYSKKRNNLDQTKVSLDENNNLYLTLPKFDYGKRIRDLMRDRKNQESEDIEKKKNNEESLKKEMAATEKLEDNRSRLERLIPEFYVNQKTLSEDSEEEVEQVSQHSDASSELSELDEKQKNGLFERMKTKKNFFTNDLNKNINNNLYNNEKSEFEIYNFKESKNKKNHKYDKSSKNLVLPFLPTKVRFDEQKAKSQSQTQNTPVRGGAAALSDLEIKNAAASSAYRIKTQPLGLIDTDPAILNIKKIREKFNIIKEMENSKENILGVDLFKYDKKKWQKKNLRESERIILGIKDFEDRRNEIMRKIFSTLEVPKATNKEKKSTVEVEES